MKLKLLLCSAGALLAAAVAQASPIVTVGLPTDSVFSTPTGVSPRFGTLINFDNLTASVNQTFNPTTFISQGATILSPDGLLIEPFSTQSAPIELFDNGANGTANITIDLTHGSNEIGIGIADFDPGVSVIFQALDAQGNNLGAAISESLDATANLELNNPGNGYYVISDTTSDIWGVRITQTTGNANFSGLAIDDLQIAPAPEPSTILLFAAGSTLLGLARLRKRA